MQDFIGSVRRSLVFKPSKDDGNSFGGFVYKIGSSSRKSRIGLFAKPTAPALPPIPKPDPAKREHALAIRWRKGELIGCETFDLVYMGMNLDSGELIAVKQVSIAVSSATKESRNLPVKLDEFGQYENLQKRMDMTRRAEARDRRKVRSYSKRFSSMAIDVSDQRIEGKSSTDESDNESERPA